MCFEYLGRVECYVSLRFLWMKLFGRFLHHEGGDCAKSCFEDFWRAGSDWPPVQNFNLHIAPSCFLSISTTFLTNIWPKYSPLDLWAVLTELWFQNLAQYLVSKYRPNFIFKILTKIQLQNLDQTSANIVILLIWSKRNKRITSRVLWNVRARACYTCKHVLPTRASTLLVRTC